MVAARPLSFRQGTELGIFNTLDAAVRSAMNVIVGASLQPVPSTLEEQAKHLTFTVGMYGAYFDAFYRPYERYVGGGADVVAAPWPD